MVPQDESKLTQHLLEPLLAIVFVTTILPTIVVYRAAVQPTYTWGLFFLSGTGVVGAYWGVVAVAAFGWTLLYLGFTRPRFPCHQ